MIASHRTWPRAFPGVAFLVALLPVGTGTFLHAQERPFPYALGTRDLILAPAGIGLAVAGMALRDAIDPITRSEVAKLDLSDVNRFDRTATKNWSGAWADRSDAYRDLVVRPTFLLLGFEGAASLVKGRPRDAATLGVMLVELYAYLAGTTYTTKALVKRKRPYVFNPDKTVDERFAIASSDGNEVYLSFFSGHAAAAFAAATFTSTLVTDLFGTSIWSHLVWGSTHTVAVLAAYARVKAGQHYPSDVIVGAAVGSALGYLIPRLHRVDADRPLDADGPVSVVVVPAGVSFRVRF
jgi:membrane-associated phospholipid phosphatase